jgi:hypothetical protein
MAANGSTIKAIQSLIKDTGKQIETLRSQLYNAGAAQRQIEQPKKAFDGGDQATAYELAKDVVRLAQSPYPLYDKITATIIIAAVATFRHSSIDRRTAEQ